MIMITITARFVNKLNELFVVVTLEFNYQDVRRWGPIEEEQLIW